MNTQNCISDNKILFYYSFYGFKNDTHRFLYIMWPIIQLLNDFGTFSETVVWAAACT